MTQINPLIMVLRSYNDKQIEFKASFTRLENTYLKSKFAMGSQSHFVILMKKIRKFLKQVVNFQQRKILKRRRHITQAINKSGLFDTEYYVMHNPDLKGLPIDLLEHYLDCGAQEGRKAWSISKLKQHFLENNHSQRSERTYHLISKTKAKPRLKPSARSTIIGIYYSSLGNYYMSEIADLIAAGFKHIGIKVIMLSENDTIPDNLNYHIVVAPHEFFYLGKGESWHTNSLWLSKTIMVNVEQPQTSWFSKAFHLLRQSSLILDINLQSASFLRQIGLPAYFLPLGYLPNYQPFSFYHEKPELTPLKSISVKEWKQVSSSNVPFKQRFIDILFVGHLSDKRTNFFATNASWLSKYRCFLHIPPVTGPLQQGNANALTTEAVIGLSQRSKILLNIHQDELDYFPWHRIVFHGLWQKALVITEASNPIPGLIPGKHYIESSLDEMESKVNWFLNTKEGIEEAEKIRNSGYVAFTTHFDFEPIITRAFNLFGKNN